MGQERLEKRANMSRLASVMAVENGRQRRFVCVSGSAGLERWAAHEATSSRQEYRERLSERGGYGIQADNVVHKSTDLCSSMNAVRHIDPAHCRFIHSFRMKRLVSCINLVQSAIILGNA